MIIEW